MVGWLVNTIYAFLDRQQPSIVPKACFVFSYDLLSLKQLPWKVSLKQQSAMRLKGICV